MRIVLRYTPTLFAWILAFLILLPAYGQSQCSVSLHPSLGQSSGSTINLFGSTAPSSVITGAMSIWSDGCAGSGSAWPSFIQNTSPRSGAINVEIAFHEGRSPGRCATADVTINNGMIIGGAIEVWEQQFDGVSCVGTWEEITAHELGHILGLGDVDTISSCNGTIMGSNPQFVSGEQCSRVDSSWETDSETETSGPGEGGDTQGDCSGVRPTDPGCGLSPIVIRLNDGSYRFSGPDDPVYFDIKATGSRVAMTWTARNERLGFLALDLNDNGKVDDGRELFGNYTLLPDGQRAKNGFEALAVYDDDGNGVINSCDRVWHELHIWIDSDHDGISSGDELYRPAQVDLQALNLSYRWVGRRDRFGNSLRYRASMTTQEDDVYFDVYFVELN